jgi:PAS domain S-box-containing protein
VQPFILIEGIGLLLALLLLFRLVFHARRLYGDLAVTLSLLMLVHLFIHLSNLVEWGYAWRYLDAVEDYVQVLEPLLWCFVLYSFMHHHATERIRRSEARLREVLEGTRDVIYKRDMRRDRYDFLSPSCRDVLGFSPEQFKLMGPEGVTDRIHPEDREEFVRVLTGGDGSGPLRRTGQLEFRWRTGDENYVWLSNHFIQVVSQDGRENYIVGTVRDISRLKEAQRKLEQAVTELMKSNEELERFAYVASHDLQEPLRGVAAYMQLLERKYQDQLCEEAQEFVEQAARSAQRMSELIQDLLIYCRVGGHKPAHKPVDCDALLQEVRDDLHRMIHDSAAIIRADELPTVIGDRAQLHQLFQNLLANALKFAAKDRVPRVEVRVRRTNEHQIFSVQDNGIGFEPEYADVVFQAYKRLHSHETYPGTGMGLAICKRIVEAHGGRIWAESLPGEGTTVYFKLPAAEQAEEPREERA